MTRTEELSDDCTAIVSPDGRVVHLREHIRDMEEREVIVKASDHQVALELAERQQREADTEAVRA